MDNKEKFDEHKNLLDECRNNRIVNMKPTVCEMEKLKYSDDPVCRLACAIIEMACKNEIKSFTDLQHRNNLPVNPKLICYICGKYVDFIVCQECSDATRHNSRL